MSIQKLVYSIITIFTAFSKNTAECYNDHILLSIHACVVCVVLSVFRLKPE